MVGQVVVDAGQRVLVVATTHNVNMGIETGVWMGFYVLLVVPINLEVVGMVIGGVYQLLTEIFLTIFSPDFTGTFVSEHIIGLGFDGPAAASVYVTGQQKIEVVAYTEIVTNVLQVKT